MTHRKHLTRAALVEMVGNALPSHYWDDVPAIRQALNDTADGFRRDGWTVGDYDQARMVAGVRGRLQKRADDLGAMFGNLPRG